MFFDKHENFSSAMPDISAALNMYSTVLSQYVLNLLSMPKIIKSASLCSWDRDLRMAEILS